MALKIGLLGGSFDPVHRAHVTLASTALHALDLDRVEFIPAANPWQREPLAASGEDRVAMLHLALDQHPQLRVNPIEVQRGGKTYTIDTLHELPSGSDYYWILGADQLANFCTWHRWQDILSLVQLAVAQRIGSPLTPPQTLQEQLDKLGRGLIRLPFEPAQISSTDIRKRLARGEPTGQLLDVAVAQYIEKKGLYQAPIA